jgi:ABC-type maltose transport system permease subunit
MFGAGGQLEGLSVQRGAALAQAFLRLNPTGRRALAVLALVLGVFPSLISLVL